MPPSADPCAAICGQKRLIKVTDGDGEGFLRNEQQEVLYENSGISRYFVRNFMQELERIMQKSKDAK